jgi:hypothetical protein
MKWPSYDSRKDIEEVGKDSQKSVIATKDLPSNSIVGIFEKTEYQHPSRYTVQFETNLHRKPQGIACLINHRCNDWNVIIDITHGLGLFITSKPIKKGEELSFNYLTTEYDMKEPFICVCGTCDRDTVIRGFKHLSSEGKTELFNYVSPFIRSLVMKEKAKASKSSTDFK